MADNELTRLDGQLVTRQHVLAPMLPVHIPFAKFRATILTAVARNPELLAAHRRSLIGAATMACQDGLLPDGREAALVIFNEWKKEGAQWRAVPKVQYMPMLQGLRKKILQSGEVTSLVAKCVYRAEVEAGAFEYEEGTDGFLRHRPMLELELNDDDILAAYSIATMRDGSKSFDVMRRFEINKVRQKSQTGAIGPGRDGKDRKAKGPWVDWFPEMAVKTVVRRHAKSLPMSGDLVDMEGRMFDERAGGAPDWPAALGSENGAIADQVAAAAGERPGEQIEELRCEPDPDFDPGIEDDGRAYDQRTGEILD
jgi:recombination protein RecT